MFRAKAASLHPPRRASPLRAIVHRMLVALALSLAANGAWAQGVQVALVPSAYAVAPGSYDTLFVKVLRSGSTFNAFELVIGYDLTKVTLVPAVPIAGQLGPLVTAACSSNFHHFSAAGDSLTISETMLCPTLMPTGPGTIYQMRFLAGSNTGPSRFSIRSVAFADSGLYRGPVVSSDTTILVGPTAAVPRSIPLVGWSLALSPNPSRGPVSIRFAIPGAGAHRLEIYDAAGRRVRALESGALVSAGRTTLWDGRDDAGRALPAGVYRVVLRAEGGRAEASVTLLR